jgi:hypothetical protein
MGELRRLLRLVDESVQSQESAALDEQQALPQKAPKAIFAVFHGLTVDQCSNYETIRALYDTEEWVGGGTRPEEAALDAWAKDIVELCRYCGVRQDQVKHPVC